MSQLRLLWSDWTIISRNICRNFSGVITYLKLLCTVLHYNSKHNLKTLLYWDVYYLEKPISYSSRSTMKPSSDLEHLFFNINSYFYIKIQCIFPLMLQMLIICLLNMAVLINFMFLTLSIYIYKGLKRRYTNTSYKFTSMWIQI